MPHRRYNPLLEEWVLCSPGRLDRPWGGERGEPREWRGAAYDPECYMCPGNRRARGETNPDYRATFVFDNDFPALTTEPAEPLPGGSELRRSEVASGRCRVLCFSPRHDRHLGSMELEEVRAVVDAWADETKRLLDDAGHRHVQIFENRGPAMGASNRHPHGQIWASAHLPSLPARRHHAQDRYWRKNGRDLLGDYLEEELRADERVVAENDHWVQLVPFWAVWPFETLLLPRRRIGRLDELDAEEREALASLLGEATRRYDALFDVEFPYSMGWCQRPSQPSPEGVRLHASYLPPLVRSASVRKFLVGYEMMAEPQRDLTPESAAARLRG